MRKRYNNCSHGMSARTIYSIFAVVMAIVCVGARAIEQPDLVGPPNEFENAVNTLLAEDSDLTVDVAEMLVANEALQETVGVDADSSSKLTLALEVIDEVQQQAAELFDQSYDNFLDLYPLWRMYVLCEDPALREALFYQYTELLQRFKKNSRDLAEDLGVIMSLEKALLPSNAYADPTGRLSPSLDPMDVVNNFIPADLPNDDDPMITA